MPRRIRGGRVADGVSTCQAPRSILRMKTPCVSIPPRENGSCRNPGRRYARQSDICNDAKPWTRRNRVATPDSTAPVVPQHQRRTTARTCTPASTRDSFTAHAPTHSTHPSSSSGNPPLVRVHWSASCCPPYPVARRSRATLSTHKAFLLAPQEVHQYNSQLKVTGPGGLCP